MQNFSSSLQRAGHGTVPDRPQLSAGVCVFRHGDGIVVRTVAGAVLLARTNEARLANLLPRLTGEFSLEELLDGTPGCDGLALLGLLSWLATMGALVDGPLPAVPVQAPARRLDGLELVLLHDGILAREFGRHLQALGARVRPAERLAGRPAAGLLHLACPDAPDLAALGELNQQALSLGLDWMAVFPFGDGIVTGPRFSAAGQPCWRCFELRWLGISPSIELERAFFSYLRQSPPRLIDAHTAARVGPAVLFSLAEALASARDRDVLTLTRLLDGVSSHGRLESNPHCERCGANVGRGAPPVAPVDWNDAALPMAALSQLAERLQGALCGLAAVSLAGTPATADAAAPLKVVVARFALPEPNQVQGTQQNWSHGAATSHDEARTLALVEAFERYCGLSPPPAGRWGSWVELAADALRPSALTLFSAGEYARPAFPFMPFDPQRTLRWNWGYNLTRSRPVLVPTSAAWYGYDDWLLGESSNGVAAHSSRGLALRNGVLELIERDAFMIHWLHRLEPPRLCLPDVAGEHGTRLVRWVEACGYKVHALDLTTDLGVPVVLALGVHDARRRPALIVGAGAALDRQAALHRALTELCSATFAPTERWVLGPAVELSQVLRLEDHARAYEHPDWLAHASFLWSSARRARWPAPADPAESCESAQPAVPPGGELAVLVQRLRKHGHEVIGVELTGDDLARHGLHVVRAIVPGLQPLALGARARLGGARLYEAPAMMGYPGGARAPEGLNPVPHCFP